MSGRKIIAVNTDIVQKSKDARTHGSFSIEQWNPSYIWLCRCVSTGLLKTRKVRHLPVHALEPVELASLFIHLLSTRCKKLHSTHIFGLISKKNVHSQHLAPFLKSSIYLKRTVVIVPKQASCRGHEQYLEQNVCSKSWLINLSKTFRGRHGLRWIQISTQGVSCLCQWEKDTQTQWKHRQQTKDILLTS